MIRKILRNVRCRGSIRKNSIKKEAIPRAKFSPPIHVHQKASRLLVYHYTVYGEESQTILRGDAMKTFKRILKVALLLLTLAVIGYFIYTGNQI